MTLSDIQDQLQFLTNLILSYHKDVSESIESVCGPRATQDATADLQQSQTSREPLLDTPCIKSRTELRALPNTVQRPIRMFAKKMATRLLMKSVNELLRRKGGFEIVKEDLGSKIG